MVKRIFWNFNSAIFESSLNSIKLVSIGTGKNPLPAIINYLTSSWGLNLFTSLPSQIFDHFNISNEKKMIFLAEKKKNKEITNKRNKKVTKVFEYEDFEKKIQNINLNGLARTHYRNCLKKFETITTNDYSKQIKTNNQFCIIKEENLEIFARIEAISQEKDLYFKKGIIIFTNSRVFKVLFNGNIQKASFDRYVEKVVGTDEIDGFHYLIKIIR